MHKNLIRGIALAVTAVPTLAATAASALVPATAAFSGMYEARVAGIEEERIIDAPIAGVVNKQWFNYRANVNEAQKELASDLRHAHKVKDQRNAFDEYGGELRHERATYVNYMDKHGYRVPRVYIQDL